MRKTSKMHQSQHFRSDKTVNQTQKQLKEFRNVINKRLSDFQLLNNEKNITCLKTKATG